MRTVKDDVRRGLSHFDVRADGEATLQQPTQSRIWRSLSTPPVLALFSALATILLIIAIVFAFVHVAHREQAADAHAVAQLEAELATQHKTYEGIYLRLH